MHARDRPRELRRKRKGNEGGGKSPIVLMTMSGIAREMSFIIEDIDP